MCSVEKGGMHEDGGFITFNYLLIHFLESKHAGPHNCKNDANIWLFVCLMLFFSNITKVIYIRLLCLLLNLLVTVCTVAFYGLTKVNLYLKFCCTLQFRDLKF